MDYVPKQLIIILAAVGVTDDCRCSKPKQERIEFPIQDTTYGINSYPNEDNDDILNPQELCELKNKVICEFLDIIKKLNCGIQPDLEFLLQEISLIYIYDE